MKLRLAVKWSFSIFLSAILLNTAWGGEIEDAELKWRECVYGLTGTLKSAALSNRGRSLRIGSMRDRKRYRRCADLKRELDDLVAIRDLKEDLVDMFAEAGLEAGKDNIGGIESEADFIARALVETTRVVGADYQMVGSPLLNNFLVHVGIKKEGFCYHWLPHLFNALSRRRLSYFQKFWGGANIGRVTENNAVVIVPKGAPLDSGIVYDPWRGAGKPFWVKVKEDSYKWVIRFDM